MSVGRRGPLFIVGSSRLFVPLRGCFAGWGLPRVLSLLAYQGTRRVGGIPLAYLVGMSLYQQGYVAASVLTADTSRMARQALCACVGLSSVLEMLDPGGGSSGSRRLAPGVLGALARLRVLL